jgi:ABC-type dipeptide/oligopeptide/nickel transport system permease subunit
MASAMDPRARDERVAGLIQDRDEIPQDLESLEMLAPAVQDVPDQHEVALKSLSQWQLARRRFLRHRLALLGLVIFSAMVFIAVFGPVLAPFEPLYFPGATKFGGDPPSAAHIFGTDRDGRDVFAMVINGARISITVGLFSMLIAGFVGVVVGAIAGWMGGRVDNILMRCVDVLFAIPFLFVILVAARFFGRGDVTSLVLIFGLLSWALIARLVRASFLSLREADFVDAARAVGVGGGRIAFRHILPNALGPVIVAMTLLMAANIVLESFVSFLNFGISETQISWGNALSNAQNALSLGNWWWAFFPGMAIALTVIAINFVGDGLRDALDPRTRG